MVRYLQSAFARLTKTAGLIGPFVLFDVYVGVGHNSVGQIG